MKTLIIVLIALTGMVSCKKEPKDRFLEVWGEKVTIFSCQIKGYSEGLNGSGKPGNPFKYKMAGYENPHKLIVHADTSIFECKVIVDGKVVYHKNGKYHELNF